MAESRRGVAQDLSSCAERTYGDLQEAAALEVTRFRSGGAEEG